MPNPLILTVAAPKAAGHPEGRSPEVDESEGATAFEDVLTETALEEQIVGEMGETAATGSAADLNLELPDSKSTEPSLQAINGGEPDRHMMAVEAVTGPHDKPEISAKSQSAASAGGDSFQPGITQKGTLSNEEMKLRGGIANRSQTDQPPAQTSDGYQKTTSNQIAEQAVIMRARGHPPTGAEGPSRSRLKPQTGSAMSAPSTSAIAVKSAQTASNQGTPPAQPTPDQPDIQLDPGIAFEGDEIAAAKGDPLVSTGRDTGIQQGLTTPRAEIARAVAGQIAAAITAKPGSGGVEIALNPEELGRVSITLNGREDGLHLTIAAERPETLELMRRHISVLSVEFQKLGYGDLSFDLGTSADTPQGSETDPSEPAFGPDDPQTESESIAAPTPTGPLRGLDMRL
ncbi:flagellar hook-length control protein FliK [Ruegeria sp.]|uniref:flagellar hook-length control protein FliK n=1 Tax=Ruegeria sp. TaxID=1879320 RepID=UPI003C7A9DEA